MQLVELDRAGVERIVLIVREGDEEELRKRFEIPTGVPMKDNMRIYMEKIHALSKKIIYVVQKTQEGFGHAVLQARRYCGWRRMDFYFHFIL
jgi:UTP-glucose-1-phosphate uridylyltransferase